MPDMFTELPKQCAEQVEIFVPDNPKYRTALKLFFDHLILLDRIPITEQHRALLTNIVTKYPFPDNADKTTDLTNVRYWENLIFGYSIYPSNGYFIGVAHETPRPQMSNYFEESTQVIKLIITNYMTSGTYYPQIGRGENLLDPAKQERLFVSSPLTLYFVNHEEEAAVAREYLIMTLHYSSVIDYIFKRLSEEVMQNEQEIWLQRWPTLLSRTIRKKGMGNDEPAPRKLPIAMNREEKQRKYGEDGANILGVIDYATTPFRT